MASHAIEDVHRRMAIVEGLLGIESRRFDFPADSTAPSQALGTMVVKGYRIEAKRCLCSIVADGLTVSVGGSKGDASG
jgi:hypothetical protein